MTAIARRIGKEASVGRSFAIDREEIFFRFAAILFCMFSFRDTLTGSMRFYLSKLHLTPAWFVPDMLSFVLFLLFIRHIVIRNNSTFGYILVANTITATAISIIFMSSKLFWVISSIKLFLPIFVGFAMCGRSIVDLRPVRYFLFFMMVVSMVGLYLAPYINYPWVGVAVDNFGEAKTVGRLWWTQGEIRYGGFAGDSTMAAFMVVFPYFLLFRYMKKWAQIAMWVPIYYAVHISTSKTALLTFYLFILYYFIINVIKPSLGEAGVEKIFAKFSFLCVTVPFLLIFTLSGADLGKISYNLFSLQDRIDNSWQLPFKYLSDMFPAGLFVGCGLGCFSYPMDYTDMAIYSVPVDNFYLTTYLMMGIPFIVTVFGMFCAAFKSQDKTKLLLMGLINVYSVTVQCYGPSFATIMVGYAFSDMFLTQYKGWRRSVPTLASQEVSAGGTASP